jgi:hypothetical protein
MRGHLILVLGDRALARRDFQPPRSASSKPIRCGAISPISAQTSHPRKRKVPVSFRHC